MQVFHHPHLYGSVHVNVGQEGLADPAQQFSVEGQHLLLHSGRTLVETTQPPPINGMQYRNVVPTIALD